MPGDRYRALLRAIRGGEPFTWNPRNARDRLVMSTERIETLRWLCERLGEDLRLGPGQIAILHGGMSDVDQQRVVDAWSRRYSTSTWNASRRR